jgi:hypothetical protein
MTCGDGEYVRLMENYPMVTGGWALGRAGGAAAGRRRWGWWMSRKERCCSCTAVGIMPCCIKCCGTAAAAAAAADVFLGLDSEYQRVIADICKKMGAGMADFVPKDSKRSSSEVGGWGGGWGGWGWGAAVGC